MEPWKSICQLGYAHLPGVLDREAVLATRRELLGHVAEDGWLASGTEPADEIPGPVVPDVEARGRAAAQPHDSVQPEPV